MVLVRVVPHVSVDLADDVVLVVLVRVVLLVSVELAARCMLETLLRVVVLLEPKCLRMMLSMK